MRRRVLSLLTTLAAVSPAAAQQAGTFEVGLFPQVSYFDKNLIMVQGRTGPGARLGYFFTNRLALEAEGAWVPAEGANSSHVSYIPFRARLALNLPGSEHYNFVFGAGYVQSLYKRDYDLSDNGVTASAGVRLGIGGTTAVRVDLYGDYIPNPDITNGAGDNLNWGIQPGLTFMLGQRTTSVRDKDGDGVPDAVDQCKDTPPGTKVDAKGCPVKDSDGDGIADDVDQCKDTPAGDKVDEKGCSLPKDADGDGVTDDIDQCKDTPPGDKVDAKGCSLPKDADGDGVMDDVDQCKNTPPGDKVDAKGCSLPKDADGDGVTDDKDRCPHTPAGVKVDEEGCQVLFEPAKKSLILEGVNFATGKAELTPESQTILDGVAESLVANEEIKVQVGGHTDNTGSAAVNKRLSAARANAVREYLISKGVAANRLTAVGYGPSKPIASNKTAAGRAQNRRVELTKLK
ncbi:MAG TPA: OmpA family protein [Gemmatimonadales bacterium]|nr:OmpA family protein [Gemmatimonadales bacterium]